VNPGKILLSTHPHRLTVAQVEILHLRKDDSARRILADFIQHRLIDRYVTPLENVPTDYRSGFLMMAAASLMIETFQCFKEGKKDTKQRGMGETAFVNFFKEHKGEFPEINGSEFYKNIRCGILHQAQAQGGFRIIRTGPIFDSVGKSINATLFLRSLKQVVVRYVDDLRLQQMNVDAWSIAPDAGRIYERVGH
jgi:hypothetical protein